MEALAVITASRTLRMAADLSAQSGQFSRITVARFFAAYLIAAYESTLGCTGA